MKSQLSDVHITPHYYSDVIRKRRAADRAVVVIRRRQSGSGMKVSGLKRMESQIVTWVSSGNVLER